LAACGGCTTGGPKNSFAVWARVGLLTELGGSAPGEEYTSVRQLEADIRSFIDRHNQNPKPFKCIDLPTKSWLQLNASTTKRSRHYAAN